ncbi:MAG: RCC1 repeat-containing protein, partial [Actinobacteria bacterium]|nr:RCC1 repeat-containing protein [Actinomycetota bacterium]
MNALLGFLSAPSGMTRSAGHSRRTALLVAAALAAATLAATVTRAPAAGAAPPNVTALALGWNHSCALTSTGGVKCWGANSVGQLGDGTTSDRAAPVDVVGLTSGVVAISAGGNRTCALTSAGGVKCWGGNSTGAIGDGSAIDRSTPTDVVGITSGATAIAAGAFHTCAVVAGGAVKCWGGNDFGELGNGTAEESLTPVTVSGLSGVTAITAGGRQTCAITSIGGAKCWGHNQSGQVGDGSGFNQWTPVDVSGLTSGVSRISAGGRHTCAVTSSGGAKCWGQGDFGQVGDGGLGNRITPVDVLGLTNGVLRVAAGRWQTCAITSGGGVVCWGPIDGTGDVGDDKQPNPQAVPGLSSGAVAL